MASTVPPGAGGRGALWRLDSDPAGWGELPLTSPGDSLFCTGSGGISWDLTAPLFALEEESKFLNVPEELGAKAQENCGWRIVGMSPPLPHSSPLANSHLHPADPTSLTVSHVSWAPG